MMRSNEPKRRMRATGKGLGAAAFLFFLAKGLAWLAIVVAGYSTVAS